MALQTCTLCLRLRMPLPAQHCRERLPHKGATPSTGSAAAVVKQLLQAAAWRSTAQHSDVQRTRAVKERLGVLGQLIVDH